MSPATSSWKRPSITVRAAVDVREAHLLHGVQVIEVAPEFLEAVRRRKRGRMVTQVVLSELSGVVSEVAEELRHRRRPRT